MSEQIKNSLYEEQKKTKPKIEDMLTKHFDSNTKQMIFGFLEYCKSTKLSYPWGAGNKWAIKHKGKRIGDISLRIIDMDNNQIQIENNEWIVYIYMEINSPQFNDFLEKENLKEIVWENVKRCQRCLTTCAPGSTKTIFGKEFQNVCVSNTWFKNPNTEALCCIKKILNYYRDSVASGTYYRL